MSELPPPGLATRRLCLLFGLACCAPTEPAPLPDPADPAIPGRWSLPTVLSVEIRPHALESSRQIAVALSEAAPSAVLCRDRDDPEERILLESPPGTDPVFAVQGLRYGAVYDCVAGPIPSSGAQSRSFPIAVGPAPDWTPALTVEVPPDRPLPDSWLLTAVEPTGGCGPVMYLAIFDTAGGLRWHFPVYGARMGVEVLHAGGGLLVYGGTTNGSGPVAVDLWDGIRWQMDLPGDPYLHHDAKQLPDGRVLTLEQRSNAAGDTRFTGFAVRTTDPLTGEVDFEYDSQRAVDQGVLTPGTGDAWHPNWVDLVEHDDGPALYVSLCFAYQVLAVDVRTGDARWLFGPGGDFRLVDPEGQPLDDSEFPQCQHGLEISADGTRLLAYDNGRDRSESRAVEYALDLERKIATRLWTWSDGWKEPTLGDIDRLPDGGVLVTEAHADCWSRGDRSEIVEIDPGTGEERWRLSFDDPKGAIYRSQRLGGCEVFDRVGSCPEREARWAELTRIFPTPGRSGTSR